MLSIVSSVNVKLFIRYIEQGQELLVTSSEEVDYRKPIYKKYWVSVNIAQGLDEPAELSKEDEEKLTTYMDRGSAQDSDAGYATTDYRKIIAELTMVD